MIGSAAARLELPVSCADIGPSIIREMARERICSSGAGAPQKKRTNGRVPGTPGVIENDSSVFMARSLAFVEFDTRNKRRSGDLPRPQ